MSGVGKVRMSICTIAATAFAFVSFRSVEAETFSVLKCGGVPRIAVDGIPVPGMCALPEPRLGPEAVTFSMKDFADIGVRFFSDIWWAKTRHNDWWLGEGEYDFKAFDRRMKGLLESALYIRSGHSAYRQSPALLQAIPQGRFAEHTDPHHLPSV